MHCYLDWQSNLLNGSTSSAVSKRMSTLLTGNARTFCQLAGCIVRDSPDEDKLSAVETVRMKDVQLIRRTRLSCKAIGCAASLQRFSSCKTTQAEHCKATDKLDSQSYWLLTVKAVLLYRDVWPVVKGYLILKAQSCQQVDMQETMQ